VPPVVLLLTLALPVPAVVSLPVQLAVGSVEQSQESWVIVASEFIFPRQFINNLDRQQSQDRAVHSLKAAITSLKTLSSNLKTKRTPPCEEKEEFKAN
jgi:hypothetical protein